MLVKLNSPYQLAKLLLAKLNSHPKQRNTLAKVSSSRIFQKQAMIGLYGFDSVLSSSRAGYTWMLWWSNFTAYIYKNNKNRYKCIFMIQWNLTTTTEYFAYWLLLYNIIEQLKRAPPSHNIFASKLLYDNCASYDDIEWEWVQKRFHNNDW